MSGVNALTATRTMDLEEEQERIESEIENIEENIDELNDEVNRLRPPTNEEKRQALQWTQDTIRELRGTKTELQGYLSVVERAIDEWRGTEIVLRELTGVQVRNIRDKVSETVANRDDDYYPEGAHEDQFLQTAIESTPPGAPDASNFGDVPNNLYDLVLNRANALNTVGELTVENSSGESPRTEPLSPTS